MHKLAVFILVAGAAACSSSGGAGDLIHLDADLLEIDREAIVDCRYGIL